MGSNRKRPFGYKMEFGEIVLHPAEAETVCWIYDSYLAGASYNALVDKLQERGIPYDGDKPWNKNMAARILADRRYTGEGGFPSIIPEGQFHMVQARRQERTTPCQKSPAQKELRKLCGGSPPAWVERQVLGLLNRLTQHPERITCPAPVAGPPPETENLRRELDELLHRPPVDETQVKCLAFQLAALQLNAIGPEEYETLGLRMLFQEFQLFFASVRRRKIVRIHPGDPLTGTVAETFIQSFSKSLILRETDDPKYCSRHVQLSIRRHTIIHICSCAPRSIF